MLRVHLHRQVPYDALGYPRDPPWTFLAFARTSTMVPAQSTCSFSTTPLMFFWGWARVPAEFSMHSLLARARFDSNLAIVSLGFP